MGTISHLAGNGWDSVADLKKDEPRPWKKSKDEYKSKFDETNPPEEYFTHVALVPLGFTSDHLETLYEID